MQKLRDHSGIVNPKPTVLVADDYPTMLKMLSQALEVEGYLVLTATNDKEALKLAADNQHLILVVLEMEATTAAIELCRRLRKFSNVPVIIAVSTNEEHDMVSSLEAGANDFIRKPFTITEFLARVRVVLRYSDHQAKWLGSQQRNGM